MYRFKEPWGRVICLISISFLVFLSSFFFYNASASDSITKNNADVIVRVGETKELKVVLDTIKNQKFDSNVKITWTSSAPNIVKVNSKGEVTGVSEGGAVITASVIHGTIPFVTTVNVYSESTVEGIEIGKSSMELMVGEEKYITYIVKPRTAYCKDVNWTSSDTKIVKVDGNKVKGIAPGKAVVTAVTVDGGYKDSCTIEVKSMVTGVSVNYKELNLKVGQEAYNDATVEPEKAYIKTVKYVSDDTKVATVSNDGRIKAVGEGSTTVTVITDDGGLKTTFKVNVTSMVKGIKLSESSITINKGESKKLNATITPLNAYEQGIIWSSSDNEIASVSNGTVKGLKGGTATITATTKDGGYTDTCVVKVLSNDVAVTGVEAKQKTLTIYAGEKQKLEYKIIPSNATNKKMSFSSSDSCVKVDSEGYITGAAPGTAVVTIKTSDGQYQDTVVVKVISMVQEVRIPHNNPFRLYIGQTFTLTAKVYPTDALLKTVSWESSNPEIVSVNKRTGEIKGISIGTATLTAISDDGGKKASITVNVTNSITRIIIKESKIEIGIGGKYKPKFDAIPGFYYEESVKYEIDDPQIASVDKKGVITGLKQGSTIYRIKTPDGSVEDTCTVIVTNNIKQLSIYGENGQLISSTNDWVYEEEEMEKDDLEKDVLEEADEQLESDIENTIPQEISVLINGEKIEFDQPPVIINDRVMVPFRKIFEALDAEVEWDGENQTVTGRKQGIVIRLNIGMDSAFVDGRKKSMDVAPIIENGRTLVPVRFIAESLGVKVDWDADTRTVIIQKDN